MRYFINLHLKMLIGIGIQWYSNFLTTIFLIGLTSSYMYIYSIRFSSVSKKLCKIILIKLVWDKRHYSDHFLMKIFSDLAWSSIWPWPHLFFFFFVVHAIAKTVHTISSTKFQRYILMNNVTGSLIFYFGLTYNFYLSIYHFVIISPIKKNYWYLFIFLSKS